MTTPHDNWYIHVLAADAELDRLRAAAEAVGDARAHHIAEGVAQAGRGGRFAVAEQLGHTVGAVDKAIARAKGRQRPTFMPHDLLDRLYTLELAELPPLPDGLWPALTHVVRGTVVDVTWIEQPAALLADTVAEAADEIGEGPAAALASACRGWTRIQTLAVLDACRRGEYSGLNADRQGAA